MVATSSTSEAHAISSTNEPAAYRLGPPLNGPPPYDNPRVTIELDVTYHGDPAGIVAAASKIEARGSTDGLFVPEGAHDPFVYLTLAAEHTERLRLGTSIALAFARSPMAMAYPAYDVHRLSGGRFVLGLGSQIKPHIERRYSMPWSRPADRMREYIAALRAIWHTWQTGDALDFQGDFYTHTLMPPLFNPGPLDGPAPGDLAGRRRAADGRDGRRRRGRLHLPPAAVPQLPGRRARPAAAAGRASTGATGASPSPRWRWSRPAGPRRSTPTPIAGDQAPDRLLRLHPRLQAGARPPRLGRPARRGARVHQAGRWAELGDLIDDEVLETLAVVGELDTVGADVRARFDGLARG